MKFRIDWTEIDDARLDTKSREHTDTHTHTHTHTDTHTDRHTHRQTKRATYFAKKFREVMKSHTECGNFAKRRTSLRYLFKIVINTLSPL